MKPRFAALALCASLTGDLPAAVASQTRPRPCRSRQSATQAPDARRVRSASSIANDRASLTLIFDSYVASTGPGVAASEGLEGLPVRHRARSCRTGGASRT